MTKVNDIALIRVERQIQFTEYIRPACLRTDMSDVSPDVELIITGWGTTSALSKYFCIPLCQSKMVI